MNNSNKLSSKQLYWQVPEDELDFKTTKDIKQTYQVYSQEIAKKALTFSIECPSKGFNAYVRGASGSGRKTLVHYLFDELKPKARRQKDYCYVHNFSNPSNPRLITLKKGYGKLFKQMMSSFADYVVHDLPKTINSEQNRVSRKKIEESTNKDIGYLYSSFEKKLKEHDLALTTISQNQQTRTIIVPTYNGRVLSNKEYEELEKDGKIDKKFIQEAQKKIIEFQQELLEISQESKQIIENSFVKISEINSSFAREALSHYLDPISKKFTNQNIDNYLDEIIDDFIQKKLHTTDNENTFIPSIFYDVNIVSLDHKSDAAPIIFESSPSITNLLGPVEVDRKLPSFANISTGSLLKADGGYLVLEVDDTLSENGAWPVLMRVIRTGKLEIAFEGKNDDRPAVIKPDPIDLDIRVILIGSSERYYQLTNIEAEFSDHFKILVDLEQKLDRTKDSYIQYANIIRNTVERENLLHFNKSAVAQLIEHGARISGGCCKISARFGRVMDLARESNYLAQKSGANYIDRKHVVQAIIDNKNRNYLPIKTFYQLLESGTIIIETDGKVIGQINGLAVSKTTHISYGFPTRITAIVSPGKSGLIDIEEQADLSGRIHTKGFQILSGLLRYLTNADHPLSFSASIAFEQSYGGIDGDSASGAEVCCLISAITKIPILQGISMTGATDQFGNLQAIGGVNEKIEGFFDICMARGLSKKQGVIIPKANVGELMLKPDVVQACHNNDFHIYAVDHILDAFGILTNTESCKKDFLNNKIKDNSLIHQLKSSILNIYYQSKGI